VRPSNLQQFHTLVNTEVLSVNPCELVTEGRVVAQEASRWLPTASARVHVRAACGVCGGQSGTGAGFLRVLRLSVAVIIPPISSTS
jgi:hypothetical protein